MYARFSFVDNTNDNESCNPDFDAYVKMPVGYVDNNLNALDIYMNALDIYMNALDIVETRLIDGGYDADNVSGGLVDASMFDIATLEKLEAGEIVIVNR